MSEIPGVRTLDEFKDALARLHERARVLQPLRDAVAAATDWRVRLDAIRRLYDAMTPEEWLSHDPYADGLQNTLTPIEDQLWTDIRCCGHMPMLMQVPAGPYVMDFADPRERIAIEADGKGYHSTERDRRRDQWLWENEGYRVFRVTGAECFRVLPHVPEVEAQRGERLSPEERDAIATRFYGETSAGVVEAIRQVFYEKEYRIQFYDAVHRALHLHRLADFEIPEDQEARDAARQRRR